MLVCLSGFNGLLAWWRTMLVATSMHKLELWSSRFYRSYVNQGCAVVRLRPVLANVRLLSFIWMLCSTQLKSTRTSFQGPTDHLLGVYLQCKRSKFAEGNQYYRQRALIKLDVIAQNFCSLPRQPISVVWISDASLRDSLLLYVHPILLRYLPSTHRNNVGIMIFHLAEMYTKLLAIGCSGKPSIFGSVVNARQCLGSTSEAQQEA